MALGEQEAPPEQEAGELVITAEHLIAELKEQLWRTWVAEKQAQLLAEENASLKASLEAAQTAPAQEPAYQDS